MGFDTTSNHLQNTNQNHLNGINSSHLDHHDSGPMDTDYSDASVFGQNTGGGMMPQNGGMDHQHLNGGLNSGGIIGMGLQRSMQQQQYDHVQLGAHFQLQQLQHLQNQQAIPPTPSSLELQGGVMTPHMFHALYGMKDDTVRKHNAPD